MFKLLMTTVGRCVGMALALTGIVSALANCAPRTRTSSDNTLKARCLSILRSALKDTKNFEKVHAGEALIWNGYIQGVKEKFFQDEKLVTPGYRIGVWRVLAQIQWNNQPIRDAYLQKIRDVYLDPNADDCLTAIETLSKLNDQELLQNYRLDGKNERGSFQAIARWATANSGSAEDEAAFANLLDSPDKEVRGNVGYGLRFMHKLRPITITKLITAANNERDQSARVYLVSALYVHTTNGSRTKWRDALLQFLEKGDKDQKIEAAFGLSYSMEKTYLPAFAKNLSDKELDVRIAASQAIIRTLKQPVGWGYR